MNTKLALPRLMHLIAMLKENRYPNHPRMLEEMRKLDISKSYFINSKTIQRDINFLKFELKAPIQYDYGKKGYYLTDPKWNLDLNIFKEAESEAAVLSMRLAEMIMPASLHESISNSKMKISMLSNVSILDEKSQLLALIATGSKVVIDPGIFEEVFKGWRNRRTLMMSYKRARDGMVTEMSVEPHVLAFHEGCWYLKVRLLQSGRVAYEERPIITLAVHRINHVVTTANTFAIDNELVENSNNGKIFDFPMVKDVVLKLNGKGVVYGPEAFAYSGLTENADGSIELSIPEIEEYKIMNFVLNWPGEAQIIAPVELIAKIHAAATKICELHKA